MFQRSTAEVSDLLKMIARPRFDDARMLQAECQVDLEKLRAALPAEFKPTVPGRVMVEVGEWGSSPVGKFRGGGIYAPCEFAGVTGLYVLAMYMDTAAAIAFGRETFGEPKRQAVVQLDGTDEEIRGSISRYGVRIIEIKMSRSETTARSSGQSRNFNLSYRWAPDGSGIEGEVVVNVATFDMGPNRCEEGKVGVTFDDGPHDIISELGIGAPTGGSYVLGDVIARNEHAGTIDSQEFLPLAFARYDDWSQLVRDHDESTALDPG